MLMSERRIIVCRTQAEAAAQRIVLERLGYTVNSNPIHFDTAVWNGRPAGGTDDIRDDVWLVEGEK
jgi:hypothetical protein